MASSGSAEKAALAYHELLHTVCSCDLSNQLDDLGVVVASITADDETRAFSALRDGKEDARDECLGVVGLLEHGDFLSKTGAV